MNINVAMSAGLRRVPSKVEDFFRAHPDVFKLVKDVISRKRVVSGGTVIDECFNPMIDWIYDRIRADVKADAASKEAAEFMICELSSFARLNSQFLKRASESVDGFCPEFSHELKRNFLEEGGDRSGLPAHYVLYSGALIKDLDIFVNGYVPQAVNSHVLLWMHDILVNSHCPSTILGAYYATEAVATAETQELQRLTDRYGRLTRNQIGEELENLDYYYRLHLDSEHEAAKKQGIAVEQGHQDGIGAFIRDNEAFNFLMPQIVDGFLQMLGPLVDQWTELSLIANGDSRLIAY